MSEGPDNAGSAGRGHSALELRGRLPCCGCGYDLSGLSIRGVCPECGVPIRVTLLTVVDPHARELQRLVHPGVVSAGLLVWGLGALGAALMAWWFHVGPLIVRWAGVQWPTVWARTAGEWLLVASGVGALAMVRPHARIPRLQVIGASMGAAGLFALAAMSRWVWREWPPMSGLGGLTGRAPETMETLARLAQAGLVALVIVLLRPSARMLEARSMLLRSGRADRQTMYAVASAVGVVGAGHAVNLVAPLAAGRLRDVLLSVGAVLVVVGWGLVTAGLVGVAWDVARLVPVLLEPAPSLRSLLVGGRRESGDRVAGGNGAGR